MRYLNQIVQDARPRRAAEPLSAVGAAPYPTDIARLDPSGPPAQPSRPQADDTLPDAPSQGGAAQPQLNADARAVRPAEADTGIPLQHAKVKEDRLPTAASLPAAASAVAARGSARSGKPPSEPLAASQVSVRPVPQVVEAQQSDAERISAAPQHSQSVQSRLLAEAPADPVRAGRRSDADTVDGDVQTMEVGPQNSGVDETRFDAPAPLSPFEQAERAAFGNVEDDAFDPRALSIAADESAEKPVTEVRIGHIDIIVEDAPVPRPAKTVPQTPQPSPARYHVRRL
ncbi:MAG: hypothetical protein AB8B58_05740 [Roseobacter sp.]